MPISRPLPSPTPAAGLPVGPGRLTMTSSGPSASARYDLGDVTPDRDWNGDGLHLSLEARVRAGAVGNDGLEQVRLRAGAEGLEAKIGLVHDGEAKLRFEGLSLKDGAFRGTINDARDYLEEHPLAAAGAVVGTVVLAHEVAKSTGPVKFDTGKVKLYQQGDLTASAVGELAITGDGAWVRAQGAKLKLEYKPSEYGNVSLEAGYDRDSRARLQANWSKTFDNGLSANASAFYEERNRNAGVFVSVGMAF